VDAGLRCVISLDTLKNGWEFPATGYFETDVIAFVPSSDDSPIRTLCCSHVAVACQNARCAEAGSERSEEHTVK